MSSLGSDLRLAWQLTRGSGRGEWWRIALTAAGAALATGLALTAAALASLRGHYAVPLAEGLLSEPGTRSGVILGLLLLLIPVLGFLGQCARIGALRRDRRLAGLRLAGAAPGQVRRIAALETGPACLLGSAVATAVSVTVMVRVWEHPAALTWVAVALVAVAVPVLGAAAGALALRRVVASPLGRVRRVSPARPGRGPGRLFLVSLLVVAGLALLAANTTSSGPRGPMELRTPLTVFAALLAVGAGSVWLSGATCRVVGRVLAGRARSAATLIAAERLRDDPWAAARTHAAVLLVTVVGTGFVGVRQAFLEDLHESRHLGESIAYYTTGLDLTAAAIAVGLVITLSALAVGTAESLTARRRGLAAQAAAGVPRAVLNRALLLETALPLAPALLLAGAGGMTVGTAYAALTASASWPWAALLVPLAVYVTCLLAAATALPLLSRTVHPAELRYT
ncbi:ABC transporter permease [Streptomyces edwardsiae]|uniref:ABC transporter permease n=1 Tax=Streptomyces edwardsiae TaxID=3075527 RepID=A0ABU2QPY2_9ACTN|nr:ABC transporter permease [Streptomyces sp. DSM 41635]MDT0406066.1 ABC transporter permease [Streptomyces sp. DSM 41635]